MPLSVFFSPAPVSIFIPPTERRIIRQINKVNDSRLSINCFYSFSADCLNSTNLVHYHIDILLIVSMVYA